MKTYPALFSPEIGKRIRQLRLRNKMTQQEFASLLEISASYLGAIERGARPVSRNILWRLHNRFALSCDYLLYGETKPESAPHSVNQVAETASYKTRRSFYHLLSACDPDEADECCRLLAAYLKNRGEPPSG